ncbi:MAG: hypothetical protein IPK68_12450 [Bdellovibrionales bacterium]|nr:hypothetical protein [Bdellovibrionales bacterium]
MKLMLKIPIILLVVVSAGACNKRGSDAKNADPVGLTKTDDERNLCLLKSTGNSVMAEIDTILIKRAKLGSTLEPYRTIFDKFKTCKDSDENCLIFWSSSLIGQLFLMDLDSPYLLAKNAELINRFDSCQKADNLCLLNVTEEMMFAETRMSITNDGKRNLDLLGFSFDDHQLCTIDTDKSCLIDRRAFLAAANLHFIIQLTYMTMDLYHIENFKNCYKKAR